MDLGPKKEKSALAQVREPLKDRLNEIQAATPQRRKAVREARSAAKPVDSLASTLGRQSWHTGVTQPQADFFWGHEKPSV